MKKKKEIAIIGAGPSGLSMALFLNELGYNPILFDRKNIISKYSKALGVNPRTLELMKPFGLTTKFLKNGRRMTAINLWKGDQHIYKNDFSKVNSEFPFMLIQPQKESEEILLEEIQSRGIQVEYDSEFVKYTKVDSKYAITLKDKNQFSKNFDFLIGADGGHSQIRKQTNIRYKGYRYDEAWELFDIELEMNVNSEEGHIRLFPDGGMIMIRLHENIWRIAGNLNSILNYLPKKSVIGKIHWESKFRINHKVAQNLVKENIVLIGDAAHLHSPVGARGMNLGIEDAFISSKLINEDRIDEYTGIRKPYLESTVKRINNITMGMAGNSTISKIIRSQIGNMKPIFPIVMPRVRNFVLGIDK
ncbi:FAD-dependent oxidoreductase [Maribacter sp. 2308TA10-17]|uniref:FAD-dependent oxidoreductase n=1 Tax=Maribacter sp. 2308TA10-17 TaxID=3386276 RepID=UPI0039BD6E6D